MSETPIGTTGSIDPKVLERIPLLYIEVDADGRLTRVNKYTGALLGQDVEGKRFGDIVVDFTGTLEPGTIATSPEPTRLINFPGASGLPQTLVCSFLPTDTGVVVIGAIDIAEQDGFRREILSLNQELGNLTRELQKSNAELARLNELKNQFLGMATHDLRKPAGVITSYSEFLLDEAGEVLNEEQKVFLNRILEHSSFMQRLIDDFLDVAMIESGRLRVDIAPLAPQALIARAVGVVELSARKKGVPIEVDCAPSFTGIVGDESKLEQVVMNLVANAVEHSEAGAPVKVRAHSTSNGLVIEVEDHGQGMAREDVARLFNPYVRGGTRKTAGEKSTGLGLAISRKIVEAHGGRIEVESETGKGSLFRVTIPEPESSSVE